MLNKLKEILLQNRKAGLKTNVALLQTIVGEVRLEMERDPELVDENITTEMVVKKFIKNAQKNFDASKRQEYKVEETFLQNLLETLTGVKLLSENEILEIIKANGFDSIKQAMPYLKEHYAGLFQPKMVSDTFKKVK